MGKGGFILTKTDFPQCISEFNESKVINCSSYLWELEKSQASSAVNLIYWTAWNMGSIVQSIAYNHVFRTHLGASQLCCMASKWSVEPGQRQSGKPGESDRNIKLRGI